MKKILKRIAASVGIIILLAVIVLAILFHNELSTLSSLKTMDDYPLYSMTYQGDYGFNEFLEEGAKSDADIEKFVVKRLLKGLDIDLGIVGNGCTAFTTKNKNGDVIYARNFDFAYTPSLLLKTKPKDGYASISVVNLTFAGYSKDKLPSGISLDSFLTLAAPFLPFDGMNEKGLAVALLAVPEASQPNSPDKITLNTTTTIRLLLDKAATVDEAIALLKKYNIYFSGDIDCQYLIADASGKSVIVEYWDGEIKTTINTENYQIASNFIAYNNLNIGEGFTEFDRYNTVKSTLEKNGGTINENDAMNLLFDVGVYNESEDKLQWSVVYNLKSLNGQISAHRSKNNIRVFDLK